MSQGYARAIYPGSFDPITCGHYDVIARAARLFDEVTVVVAANSAKSPTFTLDERTGMIRAACAGLANVTVDTLDSGLLVEYAVAREARVIVKGLRAVSDFEFEFQMALLNRHLEETVETMFLMTSAEFSYLSSSIVREIARLGGDIRDLVPAAALPTVIGKFAIQAHS